MLDWKLLGYSKIRSELGGAHQSTKVSTKVSTKDTIEERSMLTLVIATLGFNLLLLISYFSQLLFKPKAAIEKHREGYVSLYNSFDHLFLRYAYRRFKDCYDRPICSVPADTVTLKDRVTNDNGWTFEFTGTETKCINLGSYNYLGFAQNKGPCADESIETLKKFGIASSSPRRELGTKALHNELESLTAQFLGVEDAIVFGMGFATNSLNLPSLLSSGCLVVSDEKNHASIILGLRLSGATIKVYKHNNVESLEKVIEKAIVNGQPNGAPWKKILIIVEGVFSMEGSIAKLQEIVEIKKKYGAYIYLDEAHSIGAIGPRGRGVTDYYGLDPEDIDILMGTFTKSFGSAGGYIAGTKKLIDFLRVNSHAHCYASSMSPAVAKQILASMKIIMGLDGTDEGKKRIDKLARNTRYFRRRLAQIGVLICGQEGSPVVPMIVYTCSKVVEFVRAITKHNIATVGVSFPAVPLTDGRIRFCLSASHTKEQLDCVLEKVEYLASHLGIKNSRKSRHMKIIEY